MKIQDLYENQILDDKFYSLFGKDAQYSLNSKNEIDVSGTLACNTRMDRIPYKFGNVTSSVKIVDLGLITLENSPHTVGVSFNCKGNQLENLVGGPSQAHEYLVTDNPLKSLDGLPKKCRIFYLTHGHDLEYLKFFMVEGLKFIFINDEHGERLTHRSLASFLADILNNQNMNRQQKMLAAKRWLIQNGYEGNAKL